VIGYLAIVQESDYAGFRSRGISLVHQIAVAGPFLRQRPLSKGMQVIMDDNPIIWLTKDLVS
jgi:hypothetical protein